MFSPDTRVLNIYQAVINFLKFNFFCIVQHAKFAKGNKTTTSIKDTEQHDIFLTSFQTNVELELQYLLIFLNLAGCCIVQEWGRCGIEVDVAVLKAFVKFVENCVCVPDFRLPSFSGEGRMEKVYVGFR